MYKLKEEIFLKGVRTASKYTLTPSYNKQLLIQKCRSNSSRQVKTKPESETPIKNISSSKILF